MNYKNIYKTVNKTLEVLKVNHVLDNAEASKEALKAERLLRKTLEKQMLGAINPQLIEQLYLVSRKANQVIIDQLRLSEFDEETEDAIYVLLLNTANLAGQGAVDRLGEGTFDLKDDRTITNRITTLKGLLALTSLKFLADKIEQAKEDLLTPEEAMEFISDEIKDSAKKRAELTIRNELAEIANQTEFQVYRRSQVTRVRWITVLDERVCPICTPLDGKEMSLGGTFVSPTGDSGDRPPIHINCRCFLAPVEVQGFNIWDGS